MLRSEVRKLLFDVAQACELIQQFTSGKSFEDYQGDPFLRSAVERQFEIIGEALRQALDLDMSLRDRISGTKRIIAFRNRLIHAYSSIAHGVVWGVLEVNLPVLQRQVEELLREQP
jgi:uncharacterized protein with HEPN domain